MRDIIEMLAVVDYSQANEAIRIAKGKYELPLVSINRRIKKLISRSNGR